MTTKFNPKKNRLYFPVAKDSCGGKETKARLICATVYKRLIVGTVYGSRWCDDYWIDTFIPFTLWHNSSSIRFAKYKFRDIPKNRRHLYPRATL